MRLITELQTWLWYLNILGNIAVVLALWVRGLAGVYRILFLYFLADFVQSALGLGFGRSGDKVYFYCYTVGQLVKWMLSLWFVLELYGRVLAPHPALAKFGRGTVGVLLAISVAVSVPGLFVGIDRALDPDWIATVGTRLERTADSTSAILLILMSAFLVWYPVKVRRNVASYMAGFVVFFVSRAAGLLVRDVWGFGDEESAALLIVAFGCMMFWTVVLRPEGETVTVTGHGWNPAEADRLRRQLDDINDRLGRLLH